MINTPLSLEEYSSRMKLPSRIQRSNNIAASILKHFDRHFSIFMELTQTARSHFERGDWAAGRATVSERISLYDKRVTEAIRDLQKNYQQSYLNVQLWKDVRHQYLGLLNRHDRPELAETFYNSVFTGLFSRHYYNNQHIFVRPAISTERIEGEIPVFSSYYPQQSGWARCVYKILRHCDINLPFEDIRRDTRNILQAIEQRMQFPNYIATHFQLQVLKPVFYRNKAAYLIGRAINGPDRIPFIIALFRNADGKLYADALITHADDIANMFSFSRSYFMVEADPPSAIVRFLSSILPSKSTADIYTSIGFHKQGKAEFYRDFLYHLRHSTDKLTIAPGIKGMVMVVFTLPSYPYVFKVIKDRFPAPKETTQQKVIDQYRLVKSLDRVGRMADTWEFSYAAFPIKRLQKSLLELLQNEIPEKITIEDEHIIIEKIFIEHRLVPLNIFLDDAGTHDSERVIREYGDAIKEISSSGIFPGDLLTKNFGVTRHKRVIFYDYDEIIPISYCNFRKIPPPRYPEDEFADTPWYSVNPNDIFPEEFEDFLITRPEHKSMLKKYHADLFDYKYWQGIQQSVKDGSFPDVIPYSQDTRFERNR
ncbi:MAG TPA: bifunctional isocitrate dehydrogenase kinase/phosphatase [Gammaproteobacteria bacterium]|jgi:isocitrate dehydrogenase kinase/phosphatase